MMCDYVIKACINICEVVRAAQTFAFLLELLNRSSHLSSKTKHFFFLIFQSEVSLFSYWKTLVPLCPKTIFLFPLQPPVGFEPQTYSPVTEVSIACALKGLKPKLDRRGKQQLGAEH